MARRTQRRQDNNTYGTPLTVDRQMVVPVDYDKAEFPVTSANPKRSEINPSERKNTPNLTGPANPFGGRRTQSRY